MNQTATIAFARVPSFIPVSLHARHSETRRRAAWRHAYDA